MVRIFFAYITGAVFLIIFLPLFIIMAGGEVERREVSKGVELDLYLSGEKKVLRLPLEEYVCGVVSAEMPAEFPKEALKAQAVAARTYAVKNMRQFGGSGAADGRADISDDHSVNQAWLPQAELKKRWGKKYWQYEEKIRAAVQETDGEIICYKNKPIDALFHAASGERTASAEEVWGDGRPYLKSVKSPEDKQDEKIRRVKSMELGELLSLLGEDSLAANAGGTALEITAYTESGRVKEARLAEKVFSGSEVRRLLGLRSADFSIEISDGRAEITTYGYGHGVGMSQYGAAALAAQGGRYDEILKYFYTDVTLNKLPLLY
jgi:stage II sporulation protein D